MAQSIRIATWNVNSIRARLDQLVAWLELRKFPEIVCLQETKVIDDQFPLETFKQLGYEVIIHGQKSYNGVAILSRLSVDNVEKGVGVVGADKEARVISAVIAGIKIVNVYVPNGQSPQTEKYIWKFEFLKSLQQYLKKSLVANQKMIVCGDLNIAPQDIDVWDPAAFKGAIMFTPAEKKVFQDLLNLGFDDIFRKLNPDAHEYSWFDYISFGFARKQGWRIDFILTTPNVTGMAAGCKIDCEPRGYDKPSDHCPVVAKFEI